jgi:hypothetical protein
MKQLVLVLVLLMPVAPALAQTPAAAAPVPDSVTDFLVTLSGAPAPVPNFLTGCTSNYQCPTGQICCYLCGNPPEGDDSGCRQCTTPVRGGCPMVV